MEDFETRAPLRGTIPSSSPPCAEEGLDERVSPSSWLISALALILGRLAGEEEEEIGEKHDKVGEDIREITVSIRQGDFGNPDKFSAPSLCHSASPKA